MNRTTWGPFTGSQLTVIIVAVAEGPVQERFHDYEVYLCHMLPPKDGDNLRHVRIPLYKAVSETHQDHHGDWRSVAGQCMSDPLGEATADSFAEVGFLLCLDQPGKTMGRHVGAAPDGRINKRRAGCRLAAR